MTSTHHRFKHNKELVGPGTIKFGRHVVGSDLLERQVILSIYIARLLNKHILSIVTGSVFIVKR